MFINVCFVFKFQKHTQFNVAISSEKYIECLQTKDDDNQLDFKVKEMLIFDLNVDSASKLHRINIISKFRLSLEQVNTGKDISKVQDGNRTYCYIRQAI